MKKISLAAFAAFLFLAAWWYVHLGDCAVGCTANQDAMHFTDLTRQQLEGKANEGDANAAYLLSSDAAIEGNDAEEIRWLMRAAELGDIRAKAEISCEIKVRKLCDKPANQ